MNTNITADKVRVCTDDKECKRLHDDLCRLSKRDPERILKEAKKLGNNMATEIHTSKKAPGMFVAFVYHSEMTGDPGWTSFVFEETTLQDVKDFLEVLHSRANEENPYPFHFNNN